VDATEAYAECERITWSQARNFAYGIRLLQPPKRRALAAVYAFARRIDDIGDGDLPAQDKTAQLEAARAQVHALVAASGSGGTAGLDAADPVLVALADAGTRFPIPLAAFGELVDGCLADVNQATYETFEDLLWYCRCVAGSIGRLSLGIYRGERGVVPPEKQSIYGARDPARQSRMADDLGVALQLTNILRDVREDYLNGRVYLPAEDLAKFGCELTPGQPEPFQTDAQRARFASLVEFEAARAREWYASGMRLLATIDRRSAACTGAMAGIYRRLLERIASQPSAVLQGRMSLPAGEKALVAVQALAGIDRLKAAASSRGDDPPETPRSGASSAGSRGADQ
jgi:15-cis-phytoene synthase